MSLPVGHGLVGITIARKTKVPWKLAFILASLPDIDYFFGLFFASGNMLAFHRSPLTHTPPFAFLVTLLFWLWGKARKKPFNSRYLLGICLIVLSHLVLDYIVPPLPYEFNVYAGTHGLFDFIFAHLISFEAIYNTSIDVGVYGLFYVIVVKFIYKGELLR